MTREELLDGMDAAAADGRDAVARIRRDLDQQTLTSSRLRPRAELLAVNLAILEEGLKLLRGLEFETEGRALTVIQGGLK